MAGHNTIKVTLTRLVEIYGLPTLPELVRDEGVRNDPELYREVVLHLVRGLLEPVRLTLRETGHEEYELAPAAGAGWRDAAYWLGHHINLAAGVLRIAGEGELLRLGLAPGQAPWPSFREAIEGNLGELAAAPRAVGVEPGAALAKALGDAGQVREVRRRVSWGELAAGAA